MSKKRNNKESLIRLTPKTIIFVKLIQSREKFLQEKSFLKKSKGGVLNKKKKNEKKAF